VRSLSLDLRPPQLDDLGLAAAVRWYIDRKAAAAGLKVRFQSGMLPDRLHPDIETACFRIAQEAMTNVLRHAEARNVWVDVRRNGEQLHLSLGDDGRGFDAAARGTRDRRRQSRTDQYAGTGVAGRRAHRGYHVRTGIRHRRISSQSAGITAAENHASVVSLNAAIGSNTFVFKNPAVQYGA
jgi:signal transduction histidine kinase